MKTTRLAKRFVITSLLALLIPIVLFAPQAYAESYVAGQFGVTLPQSLSNGTATQDGLGGLDISDQPLKSSAMVGAKLGHYFTKARWLGIETGLSYTTPHIEQGSLTFSGPGGSATFPSLSGIHQHIYYMGHGCNLSLSRLPAPALHRNRPLFLLCRAKGPYRTSRTIGHLNRLQRRRRYTILPHASMDPVRGRQIQLCPHELFLKP